MLAGKYETQHRIRDITRMLITQVETFSIIHYVHNYPSLGYFGSGSW